MSSLKLTVETYDASSLEVNQNTLENHKLKLFPNPSTGHVGIKNASTGSLITIFTMTGAQIFSEEYDGISLHLEHLTDGLYFIKINNTTLKLLIKH